jgi:DNA-damage-inducible protein D
MDNSVMPASESATSPFDKIRHIREFKDSVARAKASAEAQNIAVSSLFGPTHKKSTGGRPAENFLLTRFGAYLVAMNGDPRKKEVAAAQSYFAVQTRVAETTPAPAELTRLDLLRMALDSEEKRIAAEEANAALTARNAEIEPKASAYDRFLDSDGHLSMGAAGRLLGVGRNTLFRLLRENKVLIATRGHQRNLPYQQYMKHFVVKARTFDKGDGETGTSRTTFVRPSGLQFIADRLGLSVQPELPDPPAAAELPAA